jgi:hypothetical protein
VRNARLYAICDAADDLRSRMAQFADGSVGHLDLTLKVRMGWHEGFQIYGEFGSVIGKLLNPWYLHSSEVECYSLKDG